MQEIEAFVQKPFVEDFFKVNLHYWYVLCHWVGY